ncbi:MAG TPA: hypothetical protein VMW38_05990 [Terriglobia bacterium]|nr:hypothetical protein [Terriglobia bacterium]
MTEGVARQKQIALPWATLLCPLCGLNVIFIRSGDLKKVIGHSLLKILLAKGGIGYMFVHDGEFEMAVRRFF